jgi:hypothetical protein
MMTQLAFGFVEDTSEQIPLIVEEAESESCPVCGPVECRHMIKIMPLPPAGAWPVNLAHGGSTPDVDTTPYKGARWDKDGNMIMPEDEDEEVIYPDNVVPFKEAIEG